LSVVVGCGKGIKRVPTKTHLNREKGKRVRGRMSESPEGQSKDSQAVNKQTKNNNNSILITNSTKQKHGSATDPRHTEYDPVRKR